MKTTDVTRGDMCRREDSGDELSVAAAAGSMDDASVVTEAASWPLRTAGSLLESWITCVSVESASCFGTGSPLTDAASASALLVAAMDRVVADRPARVVETAGGSAAPCKTPRPKRACDCKTLVADKSCMLNKQCACTVVVYCPFLRRCSRADAHGDE